MENLTRKGIMESQSVHNLTKDVLRLSEDKDIVDRYFDVLLAAKVLKAEMGEALGKVNHSIIDHLLTRK